MAAVRKLKQAFPWLQTPFLINAPMAWSATSTLAVSVTRAGGLGLIGWNDDVQFIEEQLAQSQLEFQSPTSGVAAKNETATLPIGMGVIVFASRLEAWIPLLERYKPAALFLSFGTTSEFQAWTTAARSASPDTQIWIQIGSVAAALGAAKACAPDALVLQGADAGGHGHVHGGSIVSLIPEVADRLSGEGLGDVPLLAAGGIMDGRGVAAAVVLGAAGVVMGTRFLVAEEARVPEEYRSALIGAVDGGEVTVRSTVFDDVLQYKYVKWPGVYNGRAMRNGIYEDRVRGLGDEEVKRGLEERREQAQGKLDIKDSMNVWAGAGVGLLKKVEKATDIVREIQLDARRQLETGGALL